MTDDVRCLYRAGRQPMPITDVAPKDPDEHTAMGDFLFGALMKPLYHSDEQHKHTVLRALDTMTLPERIAIEIEMTERSKTMHSYDYDPLR